jgi:hypothetical protein
MAISKGFWCGALIMIVPANVLASDPQRITLNSSSAELVLGKDKTARLSIQVNCSPTGTPKVRASIGKLGAVKSTGSGSYEVKYTPPWKREPDVALIWAGIPDQNCSPGFTTIALLAEKKIKAQVSPNARVSLKIGKTKFGPARADPHGLVEIPAKLSPGFSYGRLEIALPGGKTKHRKIKLGVRPRARIGAISVPKAVRASGRTTTRIFLFGSNASGRIYRKASFRLKTRAGRIKRITGLGGGLYSAVFRPFPSLTGGRVKITVSLSRPGRTKRSFTVRLLPGQRIAIGVESSVSKLIADGESKAVITATIANRQDKGLEQLPVEITSSRGRMGPVSDMGGGRYQAELVARQPSRFPGPAVGQARVVDRHSRSAQSGCGRYKSGLYTDPGLRAQGRLGRYRGAARGQRRNDTRAGAAPGQPGGGHLSGWNPDRLGQDRGPPGTGQDPSRNPAGSGKAR